MNGYLAAEQWIKAIELSSKASSLTTRDMIEIGKTFDSTKMSFKEFLETYKKIDPFSKRKS